MNARLLELAEQSGIAKVLNQHAWEFGSGKFELDHYPELTKFAELVIAAYTPPPHPSVKPLTDQEIIEAIKHISHNEMSAFAIARVIENVLKNAPSEANKGTYDNT